MAHSRRIRIRYLLMLASFLLAVGIMMPTMSGTSFAKSATHLRSTIPTAAAWSIVPSPNPENNYNILNGVAVASANNVWAVGNYANSSGTERTLIEYWNGSNWSIVASPNRGSGNNALYSVTAVSANNIWAVGFFKGSGAYQTLIEHWNGTSWGIVASPNQGTSDNFLSGVAAVSANNIWTVGNYNSPSAGQQTLIEHWNGTSWSIVPSPNQGTSNALYGVAAVPGTINLWAVGYSASNGQTLIEYWNGSSWSIVPSPNQGTSGNALFGVTASSASDVWAVGYEGTQTLIEQWNGSNWSIVASPNRGSGNNALYSVAAVSANNIWAVGYFDNANRTHQALIEHWNGRSWSIVASPQEVYSLLFSVAAVPGSINLWAVGNYQPTNSAPVSTLTEYYG